jgi:hypothetical protein
VLAVPHGVAADFQSGLVGRVISLKLCGASMGADDDETCPEQPLQTTITIRSSDGTTELTQVATDPDGQFAVALDPGDYLIDAATTVGMPITVAADQPTPVTVRIVTASRPHP